MAELVTRLYPYKFEPGSTNGWVSHSGNPIASGNVEYIFKPTNLYPPASPDDAWMVYTNPPVSGGPLQIYLYNSDTSNSIASYSNSVTDAVARLRFSLPNTALSGLVPVSGFYYKRLSANSNDAHQYLTTRWYKPEDSLDSKLETLSPPLMLWGSGKNVSVSGFTTYNYDLYFSNINVKNIDTMLNLRLDIYNIPSGTRLSSVDVAVSGKTTNCIPFNMIGYVETDLASNQTQSMNLSHFSNLRSYGVDTSLSTPLITQIFGSRYDNFVVSDNATPTASFNNGTLYDFTNYANSPTKVFDIHTNIIPITSGHPVEYLGAISISGNPLSSYPGCVAIDSSLYARDLNANSWTLYTAFMPEQETLNTVYNAYRPLIRYGARESYWGSDNYTYKFIPVDNGISASYDMIQFSFRSFDNTAYITRNVYASGFRPFHGNVNEPVRAIISYSGFPLFGAVTSSGTFNIYVEDKNADSITYGEFIHLGSYSEGLYIADRSLDVNLTIGGVSQNAASEAASNAKTIFTELAFVKNMYVSGKRFDSTRNGYVLDDSRFNRLLDDRKELQSYISNSGDSKYVAIKLPSKVNPTGRLVEFVSFDFKAGNSNSLQFISPIKTHYGNVTVAPSAAYIEYLADIYSSHPSGVDLIFNINYQTSTSSSGTLTYSVNIPTSGYNKRSILSNPSFTINNGNHEPIFYNGKSYSNKPEFTDLQLNVIAHVHSGVSDVTDVNLRYVNLYMNNVVYTQPSTSGITPLYTMGAYPVNSSIPLYTAGYYLSTSGSRTLVTFGIEQQTSNITLFLKGQNPITSSGNTPLYLWATTNSGVRQSCDLVLQAKDSLYPDHSLPLFLQSEFSIKDSGSMSLFLENHYDNISGNTSLHTIGPNTTSSGLQFYIRGLGTTSGAVPTNGNMNLFINRVGNDSTADRFALYTSGPTSSNSGLNVYIFGAYIYPSSISLYASGQPVTTTNTKKLYTHGF